MMPAKYFMRDEKNGFSLIEVMIASTLFSVSVLVLLQYHQSLTQAFFQQWQLRQASESAHQSLALFSLTGETDKMSIPLPDKNWVRRIHLIVHEHGCRQASVEITTSQQQSVTLQRWWCPT